MPLCFVNTTVGQAASVRKISGTGTNWEVDILVGYEQSVSPSDITLYIFSGGYTTTSSSGFGMKIRKSNGEVSFDSGFKHVNLKKAYYSHARGTATAVDWAAEGISKPAFMCNLFGGGFQYYGITISRYEWLSMFGFWLPTNLSICLYNWKDHIQLTNTGFSVIGIKTMPTPTSYSGANYTFSGTTATLNPTIFASWIDNAEFVWGTGGNYALTDSCVGDPTSTISSGFSPVGIYYATWPGSYDVFVIDGAEYD